MGVVDRLSALGSAGRSVLCTDACACEDLSARNDMADVDVIPLWGIDDVSDRIDEVLSLFMVVAASGEGADASPVDGRPC
jgi:hypothetical protein